MTNRFYESVARVLEVDEVGFDTDFRQVEGWCSLQGFGLLVLMENDWESPVSLERFLEIRTVGELYQEAFLSFAARVFKVDRACLTAETAYGSLPAWDSVNHLRLVMEAEKFFGSRYALETIPALLKLGDFVF